MDSQVIDLTYPPVTGHSGQSCKRSRSKCLHRHRSSSSRLSRRAVSVSRYQPTNSTSSSRHHSQMSSAASSQQTGSAASNGRFVGDGLDYRRPAAPDSRLAPSNVVDLTGSDQETSGEADEDEIQITSFTTTSSGSTSNTQSRPEPTLRPSHRGPRYARPIIHEEDDSDEGHSYHQLRSRVEQRPSSTVHHGVSSRTLPPLPLIPPARSTFPSNYHNPTRGPEVIEIADDPEEDGPDGTLLVINHPSGRRTVTHTPRSYYSHSLAIRRSVWNYVPGARQLQAAFQPYLDYTTAAFTLGSTSSSAARGAAADQQSTPAYEDLPPVPDGFTRSPREGDILICPFCENELCVGEGEARNQLWAVKQCGHVYCGECANSRPKSNRGKKATLENEKKFTQCVIQGCGEKVTTAKAMYQLFL